ncbi:D-tyrosyl-tRNA(Tyr) deacylase [Halorhodospira abdelmalekii]|uniref:D-aminoacyl-tRNA deacylase n=1 Tax=Halorhodospira abdelmalekii TaxID=421629 RepID=UPI0019070A50|nr:D-aminoacyl-tRNA deacylase [Halorhodospira abdelmalekii]MBK1735360.1 D-tyrosyl-tRNA(Tyr) deacylase [Halorhodospira abdelmalekii]
MIGLIQRVRSAAVRIEGETVAAIGPGLLVLIAAVAGDGRGEARRLGERLLGYRVFPDEQGRMNRSLCDCGGDLLLVPQFTLAADTRKGMRPSFTRAAPPAQGQALFQYLLDQLAEQAPGRLASGVFGADMQVELCNDGPVTFWLEVAAR